MTRACPDGVLNLVATEVALSLHATSSVFLHAVGEPQSEFQDRHKLAMGVVSMSSTSSALLKGFILSLFSLQQATAESIRGMQNRRQVLVTSNSSIRINAVS